jgi:hypothetical protein
MLLRAAAIAALAAFPLSTQAAADVCVEVDLRVTGAAPSSVLYGSMASEADAIWKPYGVRIQWTGGVDTARCPSIAWSFEVRVNDGFLPPSTARPVTLGTTWVGRLPASRRSPIHLDYAATRRLIGSLTAAQLDHAIGRRDTTASDLGRALGRVLAHEIGHGLLGADSHQRRGLMRATIPATELIAYRRRGYTLSDLEVARLRERERDLDMQATAGAGPSTDLSACDD